jgi:hypothetical protein
VSTVGQKGATGAAGNVTGAPTDPFSFIQGLLTPTDPEAARQLIDQVYAPIRQEIAQQIAASQANALARAQQMQQVYGSFAQYMGGLQGNLASIYQQGHQDAGALTAGMQGPSGGVGGLLGQMQGFQNAKVGAEQQAYSQLGASMPGIYSLQATQEVKNMLNAETATEAQLRSKLLDLSSQEASSILDYLTKAQDKDVQLKEWAYGQSTTQKQQALAQQNLEANQRIQAANTLFSQRQQQANFDLKQAQYNWEKYQASLQRGDKLQAQADLSAYRQSEDKYKRDALAAENARAAATQAGENARAAASQTGQNARSAAAIAAATRGVRLLLLRRTRGLRRRSLRRTRGLLRGRRARLRRRRRFRGLLRSRTT